MAEKVSDQPDFDDVWLFPCKLNYNFPRDPYYFALLLKHWHWEAVPYAAPCRLRIRHVLKAVERLYTPVPNKYKFPVLHPLKGYELKDKKQRGVTTGSYTKAPETLR